MTNQKQICILGYADSTVNYQNAFVDEDYLTVLPLFSASPLELLNDPFTIHKLVQESVLLILPGGGDIDPSFFNQPNTGSHNIDFPLDRIQFEFLDGFVNAGKPVIGICKGMQLINIFFGGNLLQDMTSTSLSLHAYNQKDRYHDIYKTPCIYPSPRNIPKCPVTYLNQNLFVNSAHHQRLLQTGHNLVIQHYAKDQTIETIYHAKLPIIGLQWHPERLYIDGKNQLTPIAKELLAIL